MRQTLLLSTNASSVTTKLNPMSDVITISMRASVLETKNNIIEALFGNTRLYFQDLNKYFIRTSKHSCHYSLLWQLR